MCIPHGERILLVTHLQVILACAATIIVPPVQRVCDAHHGVIERLSTEVERPAYPTRVRRQRELPAMLQSPEGVEYVLGGYQVHIDGP